MNSASLYALTLANLNDLRAAMLTDEWQSAVNGLPDREKLLFTETAMDVQHAIIVLSNQALSDIAQQMSDQQSDLTAANDRLKQALQHIQDVKTILDTAAELLSVVSKIVPLV